MDDIDQGDLCDSHYWQAKAQRTWVGLTDDEVNAATPVIEEQILIRVMEAKLKEKNT
jgi:hypothetical protein